MSAQPDTVQSNITAFEHEAFRKARMSRDARFDGRFFIGVKTTGIFCRPICPAKLPAEQNVEYFRLAAHAVDNGFRPCLRCRPDSAPMSFAWQGVKTTVMRAQKLLCEIPPQSIKQIAERLGVGERYLRELMDKYIGLNPKSYQQINQTLFAKRLLQQSRLSVEDVAHAAGFNSSRQLQRNLKQFCQLTPSQLRKQTSEKHVPSSSDVTLALFLPYRPPYDWQQVRAFLSLRRMESIETVSETCYQRQFELANGAGQITANHNANKNGFDISLKLSHLQDTHEAVSRVAKVLDCYADPSLIEQAMQKSGLPDELFIRGIRIPGVWSEFECGCRAILGQQVSVKAAVNKLNELTGYFDRQTPWGRVFPRASDIAQNKLDWLAMPQRRRDALRQFADLYASKSSPSHKQILAISGIGQWTLDYIRLRGEHDPDVWLENDLIIRRQQQRYALNAQSAAPWRSYLTATLWQDHTLSASHQE